MADVGTRAVTILKIAWLYWMEHLMVSYNLIIVLLLSFYYKLYCSSTALAFSSGVAGISAVVQTLKKGDHIIYIQCSNGDSDWLFRNKWRDFGMEVDFIYSNDSNTISEAINTNTKVFFDSS
jgi:cystathionine beta-lyase/cystathionine gamma-synthase